MSQEAQQLWAEHYAEIARAIDAHLQSHHLPYRPPDAHYYHGGTWESIDTPEDAARIAARLDTFCDDYKPDLRAAAQHRLDHIDAQRAQPPPNHHDLDPPALAAFREHLARTGARETCLICDVDRWVAYWLVGRHTYIVKTCLRCGFTAHFDALVIGVAPPRPEPPPKLETTAQVVVDGQIRQGNVRALSEAADALMHGLARYGLIQLGHDERKTSAE